MRAAAIWDMDGVLVSSGDAHYEAWRLVAASRGIDITYDAFLPTFGMANPDAIRVLFGEMSVTGARAIADRKEEAFRDMLHGKVQALPGAVRLARALRDAGHLQAIASSAPRENLRVILEELALADCFGAIASGDDIARGKPDPEIFLRAATSLGAPPMECIVLEDAPVGVEGGKRAGMKVYAVTTTRPRAELAQADRIVDSLEELSPQDFVTT